MYPMETFCDKCKKPYIISDHFRHCPNCENKTPNSTIIIVGFILAILVGVAYVALA